MNKKFISIFIFILAISLFIFPITAIYAQEHIYYSKGMNYFYQGNYKKAISFFKKAIENGENLCDTYFYLGLSYIKLKKYKSAYNISPKFIDLCKERLEENPNDFKAHYYLGYIYELRSLVPGKNEYKDAIEHFLLAHEIDPKNILVIEHIAFCYIQLRDYEKALSYLKMVETIDPEDLWSIYHTGYCYMKLKDQEKARFYFQKIIDRGSEGNSYFKKAKEMIRKIK